MPTDNGVTFEKNDKVTYNSLGRPYLQDLTGTIVAFNVNETSALVEFTQKDGRKISEWVGFNALTKAAVDVPQSVEDVLRAELREVQEKYNKVSIEYRNLSTRKQQLEGALRALNATFR